MWMADDEPKYVRQYVCADALNWIEMITMK